VAAQTNKLIRAYGYDLLINRFEPLMRNTIINEVLLLNFGAKDWGQNIPQGVIIHLKEQKDIEPENIEIEDYFDELYLINLKDIAIYKNNYVYMNSLVGDLSKDKFIESLDELNVLRAKIAHAKSTFTSFDLFRIIEIIQLLCNGDLGKNLVKYIERESYKKNNEIPIDFYEYDSIPNNLPNEEYDLDGGFVGRNKEKNVIKKLLYSEQDRIVTITGAGGVGKTAVALKTAYTILADPEKKYDAIIWFSAKETKLTSENGIVDIEPQIKSCFRLTKDILQIIDTRTAIIYEKENFSQKKYIETLYDLFSCQKYLLIIDNLETIKDEDTINFIKDIPRPSQTLITSRKGLGEIERRYSLPELSEKDAVTLFRLVSKERSRTDLLKLPETKIKDLVKKVKYYPLLIKWSIGKACLGMDITEAFTKIYSGKSEIAQFVFNDIFGMISPEAKTCLYSMIVFGERSINQHMLMHLASLNEEEIEDALKELIICSFIYPEVVTTEDELTTEYSMLSLTRGFIRGKLDDEEKVSNMLQTKYYELSIQVEQLEKSQKDYYQSLFSFGVKTETDKIAFNYIKTAKNFYKTGNYEEAETNFENAVKLAPHLNYALNEYAKFKFSRGHIPQANELYKDAIKADPENYHSYFSFGIALKKQNMLKDSIEMFKKAIELNPKHLNIYVELGRVYSFEGDYERADEQFELAKDTNINPNYRHEFMRMQFQADNYRRWAEAFFVRQDQKEGLKKLYKALGVAESVNKYKKFDKRLMLLEKKINKDLASSFCKSNEFEKALPYFEKCFTPIILEDGSKLENDPEMVGAYYFYAKYGLLNNLPLDTVRNSIKTGLHLARNPSMIKNFLTLDENVNRKEKSARQRQAEYVGIIQWYNPFKCFGLIRSADNTYIFFPSSFKHKISPALLEQLEGKQVSFLIVDNITKDGKKTKKAIKIELDEQ